MTQLANRVPQVERLRSEKAITHKYKREKVAYVDTNESNQEFNVAFEDVEDGEVNVAELKFGPPYTCKMLRSSDGKNHVKTKNDKYIPKTYTFDVTKCDEIFDLLVVDGQVAIPNGLKIPPLEQRKKRGFCKYHNLLGHKTSHRVLIRELVQKAMNEGKVKFGDKTKPQMQVDVDPLKDIDAMYTGVAGYNVVDAIVDAVGKLSVEAKVDVVACQMVEVSGGPKSADEVILESHFDEKVKVAYHMDEEELIDFLNRCRFRNSKVMLCPRCSSVFDKEATKSLEGFIPKSKKSGKWYADHRPKFSFTKSSIPFFNNSSTTNYVNKNGQGKTFVPHAKAPVHKWVHPTHKNVQYGKNYVAKGSTSNTVTKTSVHTEIPNESKKYVYTKNYKVKNPMTRTQWIRYQRYKKGVVANVGDKAVDPKVK